MKIPFIVYFGILASSGGVAFGAIPPTPPNFVVIMAEAQGWANTSVAMDDRNPKSKSSIIKTPAIERLANEGMRFTNGYAASPRCTPSRAALFTGKSAAELHMTYVGIGRAVAPGYSYLLPPEPILELPTSEITVAEMLHAAGYRTAHFGKWHVGRVNPAKHGFDESDGPTGNDGPDNVENPNPEQAVGMTKRGIAFMAAAQKEGKPFYLQLSHYPNHENKGARKTKSIMAADSDVVDRTVMGLLAAIDQLGLAGKTYVIYTADHGSPGRGGNEPLSGGKGAVLEGGLRVPFLIRGPGIAAGICSRVPVTACDVLPTLRELAGILSPVPVGVEGGSLIGVLHNPKGQSEVKRSREELVFHFPHYDLGNGGPASAMLVGHYKLIRSYETGVSRLFDLDRDIGEQTDLAKKLPEKAAELNARLTAYLKAVSAQLPVPNPNYDPAKAEDPNAPGGGGRKSGPGGKKRKG